MKGTRTQIVDLLRQHAELSIAELSEHLGIAAPAVRRHLDILTAEGMVEYRAVKQPTGRPYFAYRLTEQAQEAAATGYARLLERLLVDAAALSSGDEGGSERVLLDALLERMADHLAADYRPRVRGDTIEERVQSLIEALRAEGILERWEEREDGIHLLNSACPHRRAALAAHELCRSERRAIALLLGEEVDQVGRMVDGHPCCEYVVRPQRGPELVVIQ